jgi:hypothetical protein
MALQYFLPAWPVGGHSQEREDRKREDYGMRPQPGNGLREIGHIYCLISSSLA